MPRVTNVSERDQIELAVGEFDNSLKHALIAHPDTAYFVDRIPRWRGRLIHQDVNGQKLNRVINVNYTTSDEYPVWSPIDIHDYHLYIQNPNDDDLQFSLVSQIVEVLYTIRNNLRHGGKRFDDRNDQDMVAHAIPLLELIVSSFLVRE
jgi:hypothetical protein